MSYLDDLFKKISAQSDKTFHLNSVNLIKASFKKRSRKYFERSIVDLESLVKDTLSKVTPNCCKS